MLDKIKNTFERFNPKREQSDSIRKDILDYILNKQFAENEGVSFQATPGAIDALKNEIPQGTYTTFARLQGLQYHEQINEQASLAARDDQEAQVTLEKYITKVCWPYIEVMYKRISDPKDGLFGKTHAEVIVPWLKEWIIDLAQEIIAVSEGLKDKSILMPAVFDKDYDFVVSQIAILNTQIKYLKTQIDKHSTD